MPEALRLDKAEEKPLLPKNFCWTWPGSTWGWVFWGLGTLSLGYGVISSLAAFDVGGFPLAIIGLIVMGFASANPFATMMKDFVPGASENWSVSPLPPMDERDWHLDRSEWSEKFEAWLPDPLARFEMDGPNIRAVEDGGEWVVFYGPEESGRFPTEIEASNHMKELVIDGDKSNAQEMIFSEHPRHHRYRALYNATPPQITSRFLYHAFAVIFQFGLFLGLGPEDRDAIAPAALAVIILGALMVIYSQWRNKGVIEAWDTVTSIIKFVDGGHNELVGQVRPATMMPMDIVHVDGYRDDHWTFDNLVVWAWGYKVYKCVKVRYYDASSKTYKTRTECNWEHIRGDSNARDFLLHDGTGGIIVDIHSFKDAQFGSDIWTSNSPGTIGGNPLYTDGDIRKHQWTLRALKLSDPVYLMGRVKSRHHDDVPDGMIAGNSSRVHHSLIVVGEDAPRRHAKIRKGTEFSVLKPKSSTVSRLGAAFLLIMSGLAMMAIG